MTRPSPILLLGLLAVAGPGAASAEAPPAKPPARPSTTATPAPGAARFRLVLDAAFGLTKPGFSDSRTLTEYAEQTTIRTTYEAGAGLGVDASLQASLYRGLGLLAGYYRLQRDVTGTVDVSRPHPLYLARPRSASAELSGYEMSEGGVDLDLAYVRAGGSLEWAVFGGVTLFQVEVDMLRSPTYDDTYPYDELGITATPSVTAEDSPTGFNVGGRLDYRFGRSRRFGVGVQARYRGATARVRAVPEATEATIDVGGFAASAGVRLYF